MAISYTAKRVRATLIDYTLIYVITAFYVRSFGTQTITNENGSYSYSYSLTGLPAMVPFLFWIVYFIITEQYLGGTPGHQLYKLKVVALDGSKPTLGQTIARRLCDALEISWCFGLIAYLIAGRSPNHQRLGDIMGKTIVIDQNGYPQTPKEHHFDFEQPS